MNQRNRNYKKNVKKSNEIKKKGTDFSNEWYCAEIRRFSLLKDRTIGDNVPIIDKDAFYKAFGLIESDNKNGKIIDMYYDKNLREKIKNVIDRNVLPKIGQICSKKCFQTHENTQKRASITLKISIDEFSFDIRIGIVLGSKNDFKGKKVNFIKINVSDILSLISIYSKIDYIVNKLEIDFDQDDMDIEIYISKHIYNIGNALIYETENVSHGIFINNKVMKRKVSKILRTIFTPIDFYNRSDCDKFDRLNPTYKQIFKDVKVVKFAK